MAKVNVLFHSTQKRTSGKEGFNMTIQTDESMIEKQDITSMLEWLSSFGKTKTDGVTRLLYSPTWMKAQHALKQEMEACGFQTYFDSVGNLFGRIEGKDKLAKTILTGSHIDTVVDGGKYDGAYGVMASFLAVRNLFEQYGAPQKTIEVVSFCEEEGSRFPLAFWGSGSITGKYNLNHVSSLRDSDQISFLDAMKDAGFDPDQYISPVRRDIDHFIEIHIEQGQILERNQHTLGLVTHIVGLRRFTITVRGESNHAGTTPMPFRKDAVCMAADFISYVTKKAKETDPHLVATVGKITVTPNVPNVIAGEVEFSLDIRHHQEKVLGQFYDEIETYFQRIAFEEEMDVAITKIVDVKPVEMNTSLTALSKTITSEKNIPFQYMISGAGHDAQILGTFCPTSLLFIPSKDGISHSPKEFTNADDLQTGIEVLTEMLYKLAY